MNDKDQELDSDRMRLRLSLKPPLYQELEEISDILNVTPNSLAVIALSLGLRLFANVAKPAQRTNEFVTEESQRQIVEALGSAGVAVQKS